MRVETVISALPDIDCMHNVLVIKSYEKRIFSENTRNINVAYASASCNKQTLRAHIMTHIIVFSILHVRLMIVSDEKPQQNVYGEISICLVITCTIKCLWTSVHA